MYHPDGTYYTYHNSDNKFLRLDAIHLYHKDFRTRAETQRHAPKPIAGRNKHLFSLDIFMAVSEAVHRLHNKIGGENLAAMRMSGHLHIHRRLHIGGNVAGAVVEDDNADWVTPKELLGGRSTPS